MRTGAIYCAKLGRDGRHIEGEPFEDFKAATRYRDLAISPDGLRIYASTDDHGPTMGDGGKTAGALANPGAIRSSPTAKEVTGRSLLPACGRRLSRRRVSYA